MTTKNVKHIYGDGTEIDCVRLTADAGKALTDGTNEWNCVDVLPEDVGKWSEIDAPIPEDADATEADYIAALAKQGVSEWSVKC